ncbi:MAG: ComF family protein [Thermodesulfobacteriota bacterium]
MEKDKRSSDCFTGVQELLAGVKDLLFPPVCHLCGLPLAMADGLCSSCLETVSLLGSPLCPLCGKEMADSAGGDHLCGRCLQKKPPYSSALGLAHYREPVTTLLHRLKYQGDTSVLVPLGKIIGSAPPVSLMSGDRVIPVPLHIRRLRKRGFNQALLLARLFFPTSRECILVDTLQRIRHTKPQTGLDGTARRKNLHKAFAVHDPAGLRRRRIILVDDVYTTGTTVSECSRALLAAGAGEVHVLTLARVEK